MFIGLQCNGHVQNDMFATRFIIIKCRVQFSRNIQEQPSFKIIFTQSKIPLKFIITCSFLNVESLLIYNNNFILPSSLVPWVLCLIEEISGYCLQTVEGQKRKLEESEQLLNRRRYLFLVFGVFVHYVLCLFNIFCSFFFLE